MNTILFCGDLTFPFDTKIDYQEIKNLFSGKTAIANFEGSILEKKDDVNNYRWEDKFSLYSCPEVIDLLKDLNIKAVSLCNNHILDYNHDIQSTVNFLKKNGIASWGLKNHDIYSFKWNHKTLFMITFATFANEHSLKLFSPLAVVNEVKRIRENSPDSYIVLFPHWGREKFSYPDPADRTLAHACIDAGADLIVGHHPHVIQPIEKYKGKYIVYSIGNFILPEAKYGKMTSSNISKEKTEMAVEWDGEKLFIHPMYFDTDTNTIKLLKDYDVESLFKLFSTQLSTYQYLKIYLSNSSILDILIRSRFFSTSWGERLCWVQRMTFRKIRHFIIKLGLHKPK